MLDLPDVKRVRREDLEASERCDWNESGDESVDAKLYARLNAQIAQSLGLDVKAKPASHATDEPRQNVTADVNDSRKSATEEKSDVGNQDETVGEFEFRLFSSAAGAAPKVILDDHLAAQGEGGLVHQRPESYYLVTSVTSALRQEYACVAVSGEDVHERSQTRFWGCEVPWKVTKISSTRRGKARQRASNNDEPEGDEATGARKRKRPGKKTRIAQRNKERARKVTAEAVKMQQMEKEEHIKDKKKRLNRLKKLRKRAKEKEKKSAATTTGPDAEMVSSDGESDV
ncbi:hypothetical protein RJ55_02567 [Drechmeria coniospora]|nr:hypothetical protein RJ55_02567 [Drechmeria coniospora]